MDGKLYMEAIMRTILHKFGCRLRSLRKRKGVSQEDFADQCGLHRTAVGLLERGGRIPRLDTMLILSRELHVPFCKLFYGIEKWGAYPMKRKKINQPHKR